MDYAVVVCPEKIRNILFLTSFREGENVALFYSIKNLNKNIQKLKNNISIYIFTRRIMEITQI